MKKLNQILVTILFVCALNTLYAQTSDYFNYQAVIRSSDGTILQNQEIQVRFTIENENETVFFIEEQEVTSDIYGVINISVGEGTVISGSWNTINWENELLLLVAIDYDKDGIFDLNGTNLISPVPKANFATKALVANELSYPLAGVATSGSYTDLTNKPHLTLEGDSIGLEGSNKVLLPGAGKDSLILRGTTLSIAGSNSIELPSATGAGDMLKSQYDTDNNGLVDEAQNARTVNNLTVNTSVPGGAVFSDDQNAAEVTVAPNTTLGLTSTNVQAALEELQGEIGNGGVTDASATNKGVIQLSGDLSGNAESPAIATGAVTNTKVASGIDATKLADGSVSNAELQYLGNVTSDIQAQLDSKTNTSSLSDIATTGDYTDLLNKPTNIDEDKTDDLLKTDLVNDLTSGGTTKVLTAEQGKTLKTNVDANATAIADNTSKITTNEANISQNASDIVLKEDAANKSTDGTLISNSDVKFPTEKAVKTYVDATVASGVPDATTTTKGKVQLTGDLTGTAESPSIATGAISNSKLSTGIDATKLADGSVSNTELQSLANVTGDVQAQLDAKINSSSLATVATSGDYADLVNKPTNIDEDKTDDLLKTDLVNDLTTGGVTLVLTAEQGKVLKDALDQKAASANVYTKTETDNLLTGKVNTEAGKGLSANDYTNAEKTLVAGAEQTSNKNAANGYAGLDANSKIDVSQLPAITINNVYTVGSETAMLGLSAVQGDMAIRTDVSQNYIHNGGTTGGIADWTVLAFPNIEVTSVNGKTGDVVIGITDISTLQTVLDSKANSADLSTVATSGSFNDLTNVPANIDTDATNDLLQSDVVNDLTTGGATKVLSAEQGKILKTSVDANANATADNTTNITTNTTNISQNASDIALKEDAANKSTDGTLISNSDVKFPTEKAVKTYVDTQVALGAPDATTTTKGKVQLAGDLTGTAESPSIATGAVTNSKLSTGIDAAKLADGSVSNAELQYLDGVTSNIQPQITDNATNITTNTSNIALNATKVALTDTASVLRNEINEANTIGTALQNELDATQSGSGLATDGSYSANGSANYIGSATSLAGADDALDAQVKINADSIDVNATDIATNANDISDNTANIALNATKVALTDTASVLRNEINAANTIGTALQNELDATQSGSGLATNGSYSANGSSNYIGSATSLAGADDALDTQVKTNADAITSNTTNISQNTSDIATNATNIALNATKVALADTAVVLRDEINTANTIGTSLQNELDATQTGSGLGTDGSYSASGSANYIGSATSLAGADDALDTQVKTNADAITSNTTNISQNTGDISDNTTDIATNTTNIALNATKVALADTAGVLRDEINTANTIGTSLQNELDATQTGSGLGANGTYSANGSANYIGSATSLAGADDALDTQVKTNADNITTNAANITQNTSDIALKENAANKSTDGTLASESDVKFPTEKAVKTYVDATVASGAPDASATTKGKVQLAGDLTGTADAPVIANDAITAAKIGTDVAGSGLVQNATTGALDVDVAELSGDGSISSTDLTVTGGTNAVLNDVTLNINSGAVTDAKVASGISATKLADGSVSNEELQRLDGVTGNIQTQLDAKVNTSSLANIATSGDYADLGNKPTNIDEDKTDDLLKTDLVNDLTTGGTAKALTAEQGKNLKDALDQKAVATNVYTKTEADALLANKVNTEAGKGLSANDYTNADKTLVTGAEQTANKNAANGYAGLDANSKIDVSQLPSITINNVYTVANTTELLALPASVQGDVAIVTDNSTNYIRNDGTSGTIADWTELASPNVEVTSVNSKTGNVVIGISDIATLQTTLDNKANSADLAAVATSGSFADLSNVPANIDTDGTNDVLKSDIVNDLTTGGTDKVLSAEQGKILKTNVDANATAIADNTTDITTNASNIASNTSNIALKENSANKSADGTFTDNSDVLFPTQKAVKTYVDATVASGAPDATTTSKGKVQLAGDLTGTADAPTIANGAVTNAKIATGIDAAKLADGSVSNTEIQYLNGATSNIQTQINTLGTSSTAMQSELDATQTGAGLGTGGNYSANSSTNYMKTSTSLVDATEDLDAQVKANADAINNGNTALQDELDATQSGAGLGTDGTYSANTSANYIGSATTLKGADNVLDTQVKTNADAITLRATQTALTDTATAIRGALVDSMAAVRADGFNVDNLTSAYVPYFDGSGLDDSPVAIADTSVGIGTSTPKAALHVKTGSTGHSLSLIPQSSVLIESSDDPHLLLEGGAGSTGQILFGDNINYKKAAIKYAHSDDAMTFITNGPDVERMRIDDSGNVGIGTTSPTEKLDVAGNIKASGKVTAGANATANMDLVPLAQMNDSLAAVSAATTAGLTYKYVPYFNGSVLDNSPMTITSGGKLGFYEPSPTTSFHVKFGDSGKAWNIIDETFLIEGDTYARMALAGKDGGYITFGDAEFPYRAQIKYQSADKALAFHNVNNSEKMRIDSLGNVGIGTTSPTEKLHVIGDIKASVDMHAGGDLYVGDDITASGKVTAGANATANMDLVPLSQMSDSLAAVRADGVSVDNLTSSYMPYYDGTGLDDSPVIVSGSTVGIGTTAPKGKLSLNNTLSGNGASLTAQENYGLNLGNSSAALTGDWAGMSFTSSSNDDNVGAAIIHRRKGSQSAGNLEFYTKRTTTAGVAPVLAMTLTEGGNMEASGKVTAGANATANMDLVPLAQMNDSLAAINSATTGSLTSDYIPYYDGSKLVNSPLYMSNGFLEASTSGLTVKSSSNQNNRFYSYFNTAGGPVIQLLKARGTINSPLATQDGDQLGSIYFWGYGSSTSRAAKIGSEQVGSTGNGNLVFSTWGSGTEHEALVIAHSGDATFNYDLAASGKVTAGANATANMDLVPLAQMSDSLAAVRADAFSVNNLTSAYVPYYDGSGLDNSPVTVNTGKIGIGVTNPVTQLDVTDNMRVFSSNNADVGIELVRGSSTFGADGSHDWKIYNSGGILKFLPAGVSASGNDALTINYNGAITAESKISVGSVATANMDLVPLAQMSDSLAAVRADGFSVDNLTSAYVPYYNGSGLDNSRITMSGTNVGIGTPTPGSELHVKSGTSGYNFGTNNDGIIIEDNADPQLIISGSASNTGHIYFGDNSAFNTGRLEYNHSTNAMTFTANTSERMRINSSGYVGIGTTSPAEKLDVVGDIKASIDMHAGANLYVGNAITAGGKVTAGANATTNMDLVPLKQMSDSLAAVRADANNSTLQTELNNTQAGAGLGNDGSYSANTSTNYMKTSSSLVDATEDLDGQVKNNADAIVLRATQTALVDSIAAVRAEAFNVDNLTSAYVPYYNGTGLNNSPVTVSGTNVGIGTTTPGSELHVKSGTSGYNFGTSNDGIIIEDSADPQLTISGSSGNTGHIYFGDNGSNASGQLEYDHSADAMTFSTNAGNERMRINSSGNVGIGTASPSSRLHIWDGSSGYSFGSSTDGLIIEDTGDPQLFISGSTGNTGHIYFGDNISSTSGQLEYIHSANAMTFSTNGANEQMRINSSGDVGIGTTSPAEKLDVNGNTKSTGFIVESGTKKIMINVSGTGTNADDAAISMLNSNSNQYGMVFGKFASNNNSTSVKFNYSASGSITNYLGIGMYGNDDLLKVYADGVTEISSDYGGNVRLGDSNRNGIRMLHSSSDFYGLLFGRDDTYRNSGAIRFGYYGNNSISNYVGIGFYAYDDVMKIRANGDVYMPIGTLYQGSDFSDRRLKNSIKTLEPSSAIDSIRFVSFKFNKDSVENRQHYGVIAQEVQKYFPELVTPVSMDGENEYLTMNYVELLLLKVASLEQKLASQEERLRVLEAKMNE